MLIDFVKMAQIIPEEGSASILIKNTGKEIIVTYLPHYSKESEAIRPLTVRDTPEALNEEFENGLSDLAREQKKLVELLKVKINVAAKKAVVTKAIEKKTAEIAKANGDKPTEIKTDKSEAKSKPAAPSAPLLDLFSAPSKSETTATTDGTDEGEGEEYSEDCCKCA